MKLIFSTYPPPSTFTAYTAYTRPPGPPFLSLFIYRYGVVACPSVCLSPGVTESSVFITESSVFIPIYQFDPHLDSWIWHWDAQFLPCMAGYPNAIPGIHIIIRNHRRLQQSGIHCLGSQTPVDSESGIHCVGSPGIPDSRGFRVWAVDSESGIHCLLGSPGIPDSRGFRVWDTPAIQFKSSSGYCCRIVVISLFTSIKISTTKLQNTRLKLAEPFRLQIQF